MRRIEKGDSPEALKKWKRKNPEGRYEDLGSEERVAIRTACIEEQFGLCAYCCRSISGNTCHNEHVEARNLSPHRATDFTNIVASCNMKGVCGDAHGHAPLFLTPLMSECETELKFHYSGKVTEKTPRAGDAIETLNLNQKKLKGARKSAIEGLLYGEGVPPSEAVDLTDDLVGLLLETFETPNQNRLTPFAPILCNILRHQNGA